MPPSQVGSSGLPTSSVGAVAARIDSTTSRRISSGVSQIAGPLTIGAAALPSDFPMTTSLTPHPLERLLVLRSTLVDLDHGPAVRLRDLAHEPQQGRLAEVAHAG